MTFLIPIVMLITTAENPAPVEFIAHRGESADAPENTLAAFRMAWERGVPAVELDVHLAADGTLVVIHDADTLRTTGKQLRIDQSRVEDLRPLDAGSWKDPKFAGEPIPTLAQALETIPDQGRCYIEVKVGPEAVPALVRTVRESGKRPEQLPIISFDAETVAEAKKQLPEHLVYLVAGFKTNDSTGQAEPTIDQLISRARELEADGLDLSFKGPLDGDSARRIREAGLKLLVWTVDDPAMARRMRDLGVLGITSNKAAALMKDLAAERP